MRRLFVGLLGFVAAGPLLAAALKGRVTDADGHAVGGARVVWYAYETPERVLLEKTKGTDREALSETKADGNGSFVISAAKPGPEISVRIFPVGLPSVELEGPFDLSGETEDLEVLLPAVEPVSGRVVDEAGKPLSGVTVRAGIDPASSLGDGAPFDETKTAADGTFELKNAPAVSSYLRTNLPGYVPSNGYAARPRVSEKIVLKRGGAVEGVVSDAAGKPVGGAIVVSATAAAETDEAGHYRLPAVAEGMTSLQVSWKEDFVARRDVLRVKKGETVRASLTLSRSASITGTVVDEKTRRPVAGVVVAASESRYPWASPGPQRSATTDSRGRFRLAGLPARDYVVIASRKDYVKSAIPGVVAGVARPGSAAIALRRSATVSGRVTDEQGQAVSGARVVVVPKSGRRALIGARWTRAMPATATLADGSFQLRGVSPDPATAILASKPGYVAARRDGVNATGAAVKGIALVLRRGFQARGRVVDEQGQPVSAAEVRLTRSERYEGGSYSISSDPGGGLPAATSDRDGRFLAAALEAGEYTARFFREGFAKKNLTLEVKNEGITEWPPVTLRAAAPVAGVVRNAKGEPIAGARVFSYQTGAGTSDQSVSDAEGRFRQNGYPEGASLTLRFIAEGYGELDRNVTAPMIDLAVTLSAAGTIRGRVEDAETKQPLENFRLGWGTPRPTSIRSYSERDFQSPDGSFEISEVWPGKAEVRASAAGYLVEQVSPIEVGEGETKEGIVLSLKKGKTVTGRVFDFRNGAGVANATVSWSEEGSRGTSGIMYGPGGVFADPPNASVADAEGGFRYEGLPSGKLVFSASHPDFVETTKPLDTSAASSVELALTTGGSIAGQVVGRDGRAPVPGAAVSLQEQGASPSVWSSEDVRADDSGRFEFSHLKEGRYRLSARDAAGRAPPRDVVVGPAERVGDAILELVGGSVVRGRVGGIPSEQLSAVRVSGTLGDFRISASVGDDGQFVLRDVPSGILRIFAFTSFPQSRSTGKTVEVPEGAAEVSVDIVFEGGSRLSGRVLRGEKGVAGLYVGATPEPATSGATRVSSRTDENGRYALDGLNDGPNRLSVSGEGISVSRIVTVSGDSVEDVVLRGVSLSGVVTDADSGEPIRNAEVRAQGSTPSAVRRGQTDSGGRYSLEDVEADSYRVTAQRSGYQQKTQEVSVASTSVELNVMLARGGGLLVRASDGLTGLPLQSVEVTALAADRTVAFWGTVSLDSSGQGEISSLAPGTYRLQFFSTGYAPQSLTVGVPSPTISVAMTPGGTLELRTSVALSARILDSAGNPYRSVSLIPPAMSWEHFSPGSYQLIVAGPGGQKSYPFTIAEGGKTTVEVK